MSEVRCLSDVAASSTEVTIIEQGWKWEKIITQSIIISFAIRFDSPPHRPAHAGRTQPRHARTSQIHARWKAQLLLTGRKRVRRRCIIRHVVDAEANSTGSAMRRPRVGGMMYVTKVPRALPALARAPQQTRLFSLYDMIRLLCFSSFAVLAHAGFSSVNVCANEAASRGDFDTAAQYNRLVAAEQNNGSPRQLWACGAQCADAASRGDFALVDVCHASLSAQCVDAARQRRFNSPQECEHAIGLVAAMQQVAELSHRYGSSGKQAGASSGWQHHHTIIVLLLMNLAGFMGAVCAFWMVRRTWQGSHGGSLLPTIAYVTPGKL